MAGIQSLGIGSGLLTSDLVDQLVEAERAASDLRLDAKSARVEAKISAYGELRTVLEGLQSSISSLALSSTIQKSSASSSDTSVLSATTNSTAEPGSYRLEVDEIATAHSLASKQYDSVDDTIGTGTLTINFGTTTYDVGDNYQSFTQDPETTSAEIEITSENNTVGGIRDAINNADIGVSASVVYDGTGYRLLLTSEDTGEATSMEIAVSGDAGLQSLAYNATQNDPNSNMEETQKGADAALRINGLSVSSSTNTLDQVVKGVSINLTASSVSAVTLSVQRDVSEIADKIDTFVEKYNEYKTIYDELSKYNPAEEIGGILLGDNAIRTIQSQLRSGLSEVVTGLTGSSYSSLVEIGISTDQNDNFNLVFNRNQFIEAMKSDAQSVVGLMATDTDASDAQIKVVAVGPKTQPGEYDVEITQNATQGSYQGLSTGVLDFSSDVVVSDVNDRVTFNIDGTTKSVYLEQGSYSDGDSLALMLQNNINTTFNGQSVTVEFDATNQRFDITSSKFGSSSQVAVTSADDLVANSLGLVSLGGGQAVGSYFSTLNDAAFAATTSPGLLAVTEDDAFDFSSNTVNFDLTLAGTGADGTYAITFDEDWSDVLDSDGNVATDRDRSDVLTYIQSELNDAGLAGVVTAEFNSSDRLVFRTEPDAGNQTITIANTTLSGADYLGMADGAASSGVAIAANTDFELSYTNRYGSVDSGTITVTPGTYETAADLAADIEAQINADAAISSGMQGAMTEKGARSLASAIDFSSDEAQFIFDLNGTDYTVDVTSNGTDNLDSIQSAIDAVVGAGVITASLDGSGLVLSTVATGSAQALEIKQDGIGASTAAGSVDLSVGVDFSATPSAFTLKVDGFDIDVTVDGDGTQDTNDGESNLAVIQAALDTALASAGGGGEFTAGDVVAKLDVTNQLYFESVSKNGEQTEATFGADASIQITAADANANAVLGIASGAISINGYDGFGLDKGQYIGFDSQSTVTYDQDDNGNGRFTIAFDNATDVTLANVSLTAITQLGLADGNGAPASVETGLDVEGTVNGVEASGRGQYLTASEGSQAATNGYLLGGTGWDFTSAAVVTGSNNTLKVEIDGIESGTISLTTGAYSTGEALAAELKKQINADTELKASSKTVDVQYDADTNIFGIFSVSKGNDSSVSVSEITTGGIDLFGFTTSTPGVNGKNALGSIDDAAGMMLRVSGARIGERGSVTYVQGIMSKFDDLMNQMLGVSGILTEKENNLTDDQDQVEEERTAVDVRIAAFEERLRAKFLYNDKLISQLKTTEDFLTRQFEAMTASTKDN